MKPIFAGLVVLLFVVFNSNCLPFPMAPVPYPQPMFEQEMPQTETSNKALSPYLLVCLSQIILLSLF